MNGLLEGLRVLEMGHIVAIPCIASTLAEWGADVIKLEPPTGELSRTLGKSFGISRQIDLNGSIINWPFELHNRGKKSLALNLKTDEGREIVHKLIESTDIFITNYEVEAVKNLGMDFESLSRVNPKLIYGFLTGYGTHGPDKDERGFDLTAAWARSGAQYLTSDPACPPPPQRFGMMDKTAAGHLLAGLLAAVIHRDRTGLGQEIDISLYHTAVWSISIDIQSALVGTPFPRHDHAKAGNPFANNYCSKDGRWFLLFNPLAEICWPDFCKAFKELDLDNDIRFSDSEKREANAGELIKILDQTFASINYPDLEKRFRSHNIIYGIVQTPTDVVNDPQALANNFFTEVPYSGGGKMKLVNTPVNFRQNPGRIKSPAPEVGQHTEEILLELGYSWENINLFQDDDVIP